MKEIILHVIQDENIDKNELIKENFENTKFNFLKISRKELNGISELMKLDQIKQINFLKIEEYLVEINNCIESYCLCEKIGKKEKERRIRDAFLKGLGEYTDIEIYKLNMHDLNEIVIYLSRLETKLISISDNNKFNQFKSVNDHTYQKYRKNEFEMKGNLNSEIQNSKWCSFHGTKSHNTKDCNNNKEVNSYEYKDKNFILKESFFQRKNLEVEASLNNKKITFTIDTGATKNYIRKEFANELGIRSFDTLPIKTIFGNNNYETCDKIVETILTFKNLKNGINVNFYVLDNLPVNALLGNDFLISNKCTLDLVKYKIWIDNEKISMVGSIDNDEDSNELDQILCEKLNIVNDEAKLKKNK
ncbi:hypothetical protein DMUE_1426 [Dictyocoela muelleri]|nr:hypothetical protein DMUE_1426 [Dictyocoela muelleri]